VAKVAEAHGGRVKLESVEGQGTEITVCFAAE
jgi:signal transduction histidine kinase